MFHTACCVVFETDALQVTEIGITARIPLSQHGKVCLCNLLLSLSFIPQGGMTEKNQIYVRQ